MTNKSLTVRALPFVALGFTLSLMFEVLDGILSPDLPPWLLHIVAIALFTSLAFFLTSRFIKREREFLKMIKTEEEFSNAIIENLPVMLCIFDADGNFLRWNPQLEATLGYSKADLSRLKVLDTVAEEDRERILESIQESLGTDRTELEALLLHRNGSKIPFYLTSSRIDFQGKSCVLGIAVDISTQRRAQEQLRLQAAALQAAANGIVITRCDGVIEWVNPAFTKMTGFLPEEAIGKTPRILRSEKQGKAFYDGLWATISSGKAWCGEITNRRKDGTAYIEEMTITPVALNNTTTHYIAIKQDISARKLAEGALERAEERYRDIFDQAVVGIFQSTPEGRFVMMNPAMAKMLRYGSAEHAVEEIKDISRLYHNADGRRQLQNELEAKGMVHFEHEFHRRDGTEACLSLNMRCIYNDDGSPAYYEGTAEDTTETRRLEKELRQAQKMEAVGRLAGGVAHDFNNMIGVITGYSELLKSRDLDRDAIRQIEEIQNAGRRAARLTQQLLAFSRKQVAQRQILDLNETVAKLSGMLRRLIGEDIELSVHRSAGEARVNVDAGQIDQVIMNLAVNARDAMPKGGKLMIETDTCELDAGYSMRHRPIQPGTYVRLTISDSGCGMDQETMSHLFEPFFTTKELGRGTGLGLSIVYGIVKQSGGYIWAYSEPGLGSSFKIYLPLQHAKVDRPILRPEAATMNGSENILVVEDDQGLRSMIVGFLRELGYSVLEAENGEHALEIANGANPMVQALVTDIVMPKMSGRELADRLTEKFPSLKVLYTSGYTHDGMVQTRTLSDSEVFLQKPFALAELSKRLRQVIESETRAMPKGKVSKAHNSQ